MSSSSSAEHPKKRYTPAEIEAELAKAEQVAPKTCQQLNDELQNDVEVLQSLEDYPAQMRARVVAWTRRDMQAVAAQMRRQHCTIE